MNLGSNASITGVGNTTINVAGLLTNQGRLSSAGDLLVNAGSVNNLGTLGGNQLVRVTTGSLRNDRGLLFSGGDMQLYTDSLTNFYGDVYSLAGLTVARDGAGNRATLLENISGSLESAADMSLRAATIDNRKEFIKTTDRLISGAIGLRSTGRASGHYVLQESYETKLEIDTPASMIAAGGHLQMQGQTLTNSNSVMSARGDLIADFATFNNVGTSFGSFKTLKSFNVSVGGRDWLAAAAQYNAANDPGYSMTTLNSRWARGPVANFRHWDAGWNESVAVPRISGSPQAYEESFSLGWINSWGWRHGVSFLNVAPAYSAGGTRVALPAQVQNFFDTRTVALPGQAGVINAVVQAGGRVQINATQNLTNSVIQQSQAIGSPVAKSFDPALPGATGTALVSLHAQLPPDLARQQVNPLTLGSFTLPTGQNGLFRLSGASGNSAMASSPSWTFATSAISTREREALTPVVGTGTLQAGDAVSTRISDSQIERVGHQASTLAGQASSIGVLAPTGASVDVQVPQRSLGATGQALSVTSNLGISGMPRVPGLTPTVGNPYVSKPHKYLIETNPVLTELKQFMSSDYLLGNLGYDPDQSWKRLGDGLYEQRLIQQAVVARTGQQFIDGQTSGEQLFKYLMDNAIRSKDQLQLSLGVGLTASQVAALTHDIVWMEKHQVNGEEVLVPVLYLAQANNRLAPNGALIAGQDVQLIAGENLTNVGILQASRNLSATAGNNLVNTGLIHAGERLELLAGNNLSNSAGGIITGRDVSLTAVSGNIIRVPRLFTRPLALL
ncbi:S-layer family protein [Pseudomonas sp. B21-044]|nr:S-layer family protein [Pseudomonas sp. B21-044]UVL17058.1 S-layer family protein [Pseudomonas sp. B21-044]